MAISRKQIDRVPKVVRAVVPAGTAHSLRVIPLREAGSELVVVCEKDKAIHLDGTGLDSLRFYLHRQVVLSGEPVRKGDMDYALNKYYPILPERLSNPIFA